MYGVCFCFNVFCCFFILCGLLFIIFFVNYYCILFVFILFSFFIVCFSFVLFVGLCFCCACFYGFFCLSLLFVTYQVPPCVFFFFINFCCLFITLGSCFPEPFAISYHYPSIFLILFHVNCINILLFEG